MLIKSTTALVTAGFMLAVSSVASADDQSKEYASIAQLPEAGSVTLTGTVEGISSNKEFTLRDANGKTIEIDSKFQLTLHEGDRVKVVGVLDDKALGLGKEIDATSVTVIDAADETSRPETQEADEPAPTEPSVKGGSGDDEMKAVDALPDEGPVTITGTIEKVADDKMSFTLKGESGETIDVHTKEAVTVTAGQKVKVTGVMDSEVAGLGEQIVSAKVVMVS